MMLRMHFFCGPFSDRQIIHSSGGKTVFTIYSDSGSDSTMVSNLFIDEYMKSANDAQIKVYLYLLRMMGTHRAASVSDMADQFNHTERDVVRSLRYWEQKGLLNLDFDNSNTLVSIRLCRPGTMSGPAYGSANRVLSFSQPAADLLPDSARERARLRMASGGVYPPQPSLTAGRQAESEPADRPETAAADSIPPASFAETAASCSKTAASFPETTASCLEPGREYPAAHSGAGASAPASGPSELEALEIFRNDPGRQQLLFVIEQYIGKPLSLNEVRIIYHISEKLHFSNDMIDYLLQYCVDRGKKDFRYIKKVAKNWAESGIFTPMQAEQAAVDEAYHTRKKKKPQGSGSGNGSGDSDAGTGAKISRQDAASSPFPPAEKKKGRAGKQTRSANSFNQFEQNDYDFDELEKELLGS